MEWNAKSGAYKRPMSHRTSIVHIANVVPNDIVRRLLELTGAMRPPRPSEAIIPPRWYRFHSPALVAILLSSTAMTVGYAMSADFTYVHRLEATICSLGFVKSIFINVWLIRNQHHLLYVLLDLPTKHGTVFRIAQVTRAPDSTHSSVFRPMQMCPSCERIGEQR